MGSKRRFSAGPGRVRAERSRALRPGPSARSGPKDPGSTFFSRVTGGLMVLSGIGLGGLAAGAVGAAVGGLIGASGAVGVEAVRRRRERRRRRALSRAFPSRWRVYLEEHYDHYLRLPPTLRSNFEDDLRIFLAERRITGIGLKASEELRLLTAASAVTLSLAWPRFEWDHVSEVLLYPQEFDRDYSFDSPELVGLAHPWGTVILSVPALRESFEDPHDGYHVGLHEFAHLLDVDGGRFDGIPADLTGEATERWDALVTTEMERLRRGRSLLDPYATKSPAEFFAVAVEAFFEQPQALRRRHQELYDMLSSYFSQDPAAWDDARGLAL